MSLPFYDMNGLQIHVYNAKVLLMRMANISDERDTGYISLPSIFRSDSRRETYRFYSVLNYNQDDGNEFGLWMYVFDPAFNHKIRGCTFRVIKGNNTMELPATTSLDSAVGIYRSPCYDIWNNEAFLQIMIYLPNMSFEIPNLNPSAVVPNITVENVDAPTDRPTQSKKLIEVNISDELSAAYKNIMNNAEFDVHFVINGRKIGTFKFALCAVSDVFSAAFKGYTKESQTGEIIIHDFEYKTVRMFVDALHSHIIYFDDNPATTLKLGMLANKYNVISIERAARNAFNVMDVNPINFVDVYRLAAYDDDLVDKITQRFVDMKADTQDIVDFYQLNEKIQFELFRSAHKISIGK